MSAFQALKAAQASLCRGLLLAMCVAGPWGTAEAATFSGPITVSLLAPGGITSDGVNIDPTPLDLVQALTPPAGTIVAGDAGQIGSFMLAGEPTLGYSGEQILLSGTTLHMTIAEGVDNGTTGYLGAGGQHARYVFDGLNIVGQQITGVSFTAFDNFASSGFVGISNLSAYTSGLGVRLLSPSSLEVDLDTLNFVNRGNGTSLNHVDLSISFTTAAVPEPSGMALSLMGLGALLALSRRHARQG